MFGQLSSLFGPHTLITEFLGRLVGNCMFQDVVWCLTGFTDLILAPSTDISRDILLTEIILILVTTPASKAASPACPPFFTLLINHTASEFWMLIDKWYIWDKRLNLYLNCFHWSKYVLWQQVSLQHMSLSSQSWWPEHRGRTGAQKLVSSSYTVLILRERRHYHHDKF